MFKKYLPYLKKYRVYAIWAPITMVLETLASIIVPSLMETLVNDGIMTGNTDYVVSTGITMILISLGGLLVGSLSAWLGATAGYGAANELQKAEYRAVQGLSFSNLDQISGPSLITRLTSDINIIGQVTMMSTRIAFRAPTMLIFALIFAFRIDKGLASIFLISVPFGALFIYLIFRRSIPFFFAMREKVDDINSVTREQITGIREIKAFNRMPWARKNFNEKNENFRGVAVKGMNTILVIQPLMTLLIFGTIVGILYRGGIQVYEGQMQAGTIIAFLTYAAQIANSLIMITNYIISVLQARASFQRVFEVLEMESEIKEIDQPVTTVQDGSIRFDHVSFSYPGYAENTLEDLTFDIHPGEHVAIVGSTGAGKTSLVQLIPRLYDVDAGSLSVGGVDVRNYQIQALRKSIGFVLQKNRLVSGTIRSNMLWGDPDASDEEIITALKQAQAWEFVSTYSDGLDHIVEQGGANFSGGQKQRLTMARAFLRKPKILIMDDATSAVDMDTDARIRKMMRESFEGVTVILIAQRIESVMDADTIIVLNNGKVENMGSHDDLLKQSTIYREIYESQTGGIHE